MLNIRVKTNIKSGRCNLNTNTVEDPAHCAIPPTSEHPEIRDIMEKVEPIERQTQI